LTLGYGLADDEHAADRWSTSAGGEYGAFGLGAAVTGRRADLVILDDIVASREAADSEVQREATWEWYQNDLYTRLKPGGRVVLIMTRWHEDDLAGRLLASMGTGGDQWRVLNLPALAEDNDPLGRAPGDPIWPEWEDAAALQRKRNAVGERTWWALYQQSPRPLDGALFKIAMIQTLDAAPVGGRIVRAWDLAATEQVGTRDPDYTVGLKMARTDEGRFVVLDVVRLRGGPDEVEAAIVNTAAQDGRSVTISIPQDPGQAGVSQALYYTRKLAGYKVNTSRETGDKSTRAAPVASQINVGNLSVVRAPWNRTLLDEMAGFPSARHDDCVDGLSRAFNELIAPPAPARVHPLRL
jgi:predicted phage terminase large subunit-like protein